MTNTETAAMLPQKTGLVRQLGAALLLLAVTAMWGGGFIFTKNALAAMPPLYFLFFRFSLGALVTAACASHKLKLLNADLLKKGLLTGIPLFAGYAMQTIGLQYTSVGNSAFITGSYVVMVPFVGWVFTRELKAAQIALGFLALAGLACFSLQGEFRVNRGDLWTLACAAAYAVHFVMLGRYTRGLDSLLLTLLQIIMGAVLAGLIALLLETPPAAVSFNKEMWTALIYCGALATALAFFIQTAAQKVLSPTQASVIFTSEALFGSFFGWLFLGELFSARQFVGAFILMACVIGVLIKGQK